MKNKKSNQSILYIFYKTRCFNEKKKLPHSELEMIQKSRSASSCLFNEDKEDKEVFISRSSCISVNLSCSMKLDAHASHLCYC